MHSMWLNSDGFRIRKILEHPALADIVPSVRRQFRQDNAPSITGAVVGKG